MKKLLQKITPIAILLFIFQITLTAQPVGSQIKVGTDSHISYWNGVTWMPITPDLPGKSLQFTAGVPTWVNNPNGITTTAASSITGTTAVSGCNILSDGGATITARGVCWSTSANPTIADVHTTDGTGIGSFTSNITGLNMGTTYYIRAYATNSFVTAYGNEIIFITPFPVYDIDGNGYDTVHIGTQIWMKQNLKTTHYKNGVAIPNITNNNTWSNLTSGAFCNYNNDITIANTYGLLYNWHTVNTGNLCPTGWHVPNDAEWTTLTTYLGGSSIAGDKLKEAGTTHWYYYPNIAATNETGFTALPGGYRRYDGVFYGIYFYGRWWSSTESYYYSTWYMGMHYDNSGASNYNCHKTSGLSVRCVKD